MIGLSLRYIKHNKKQTFTIVFGTVLASILMLSVGILFSSFRAYLIEKVLEENNYHVRIKGDLDGVKGDFSLNYQDGEYLIKFEDIKQTYNKVTEICKKVQCDKIVYNVRLLSLYGIGNNNYLDLFKKIIFVIVFILGVSVFFIIYNSFQIGITKKRRDIALFKMIGASNACLYKIFFVEGLFCFLVGICLGFGLSLFIDIGIINLMNEILSEVLGGRIKLYIYIPFLMIPLIFILIIVFLSVFIPLFRVMKYKAMDLFKESKLDKHFSLHLKNFTLNYAYINYKRNQKKYRSLIVCVFILMLLFNSFVNLQNYTLKILNDYIRIPKYDLKLVSSESDYNKLKTFVLKLGSQKKTMYQSCIQELNYDLKDINYVMVTDLGGNEVINLVDEIDLSSDKAIKKKYEIFQSLDYLNLNGINLKVKLTQNIPFGFENELITGRIILNLNRNDFEKVCPISSSNVLIKTDRNDLDKIVKNYASKNQFDVSYINVKKASEIMNNFVLLIKFFTFFCVLLISLIAVFAFFNIVSANIQFRKKEFATLKSLGLINLKISLCLLFESLIVSFKGVIYSFPFILIISNSLYKNLGSYFDISLGIFDYPLFLFSFIMCFLLIFICMIFSHLNLYHRSLIWNIKNENLV